jgi:phosphoserine phosphatase RsbU/P
VLLRFESDENRRGTADPLAATDAAFELDMTGDESSSTIMGSMGAAGGFGMLDVQPQAKLKAVL